jgi:hypothetical protein
MPKFDAEALVHIVALTEEMLTDAGFTGVKLEATALPAATIAAFGDEFEGEDVDPASLEFAKELAYHRVTTDQGTFGLWFEPYPALDLTGLGLDLKAFLPAGASDEDIPEDWSFIGIDEGVPEKLFSELIKKSRQP